MSTLWPGDNCAPQPCASILYLDAGESSGDWRIFPVTGYETMQWKKYRLEDAKADPGRLAPDDPWRSSPLTTVPSAFVQCVRIQDCAKTRYPLRVKQRMERKMSARPRNRKKLVSAVSVALAVLASLETRGRDDVVISDLFVTWAVPLPKCNQRC
jgi:hypothetical protein